MKILKILLFSIIILIIVAGYHIYTRNQVKIPNSLVQNAITSKFPMEHSYPFGKIKLFNPKIYFENNKLVIETEYLNNVLNDEINGTITFTTDIRYETENSNLYLKNFQIEKLTKENKENKEINLDKNPLIRPVLDYIFTQFEKKEIANLSNIDKFKMVKDIKIENNKLTVVK
jgi:hypothetical protein